MLHPDIRTELGRDRVDTIARNAEANSQPSLVVTTRRLPGLARVPRLWPRTGGRGSTPAPLRHRETT